MKSTKTNFLLGIIAINLTFITLVQLNIWPPQAMANNLNTNVNYGLVPLNENGSIDVNISSSADPLQVDVREWGGTAIAKNTVKGKDKAYIWVREWQWD